MYDNHNGDAHNPSPDGPPAPEMHVWADEGGYDPTVPVSPFPPYPDDNAPATPPRRSRRGAWWWAAAGVAALGVIAASATWLAHAGGGHHVGEGAADQVTSAKEKGWDRPYQAVEDLCAATDLSMMDVYGEESGDPQHYTESGMSIPEYGTATGMVCATSYPDGPMVMITAVLLDGTRTQTAEAVTKTVYEADIDEWSEGCGDPVDEPGHWDAGVTTVGGGTCYLAGDGEDTVSTVVTRDGDLEVSVQLSGTAADLPPGTTTTILATQASSIAEKVYDACAQ